MATDGAEKMGLCETRGTKYLLLGLILNLLAKKPVSYANVSLTDVSEPVVKIMDSDLEEFEFGECSVTCGIGIREVILTNGCPGGESKCIIRMEECRGPPDCGWGKPLSESLESLKIPCVFVPPENRFQYVWKLLIPDEQSLILPNDSAILEVHRDTNPVVFECETLENEDLIASIKYTVYTSDDLEAREIGNTGTNVILMVVLITGIIISIGLIIAIIFIIFNWPALKLFWQMKVQKSRTGLSSTSMRTSSGMISTADNSQVSQVELTTHDQVSYQEMNEPVAAKASGEGRAGGGAGGGAGGSGEKGAY